MIIGIFIVAVWAIYGLGFWSAMIDGDWESSPKLGLFIFCLWSAGGYFLYAYGLKALVAFICLCEKAEGLYEVAKYSYELGS